MFSEKAVIERAMSQSILHREAGEGIISAVTTGRAARSYDTRGHRARSSSLPCTNETRSVNSHTMPTLLFTKGLFHASFITTHANSIDFV